MSAKIETLKHEPRKWHVYAGWTCVGVLLAIASTVYALKFIQLDAWQYYFFRGTSGLGDSCSVAVQPIPTKTDFIDRKLHLGSSLNPIAVPHKGSALAPYIDEKAKYVSLHYACRIDVSRIPRTDGSTYLHLGWVFGDHTEIDVNGQTRAAFNGNDKPIVQIMETDGASGTLSLDIWVNAPARARIGLAGGQPSAFAGGSTTNNRIMGLETALALAKPLYYLLPIIFLGLVCVLGWMQGFRSRLIVAAMFYCIFSAIQNLVYVGLDLLPFSFNVAWALGEMLAVGTGFAFLVFAMELLGVFERHVRKAMVLVTVTIIALVIFHSLKQDRGIVYDGILPVYGYVMAFLATTISILAWRRRQQVADDRRRVHIVFTIFVPIIGLLPIFELILNRFQIWVSLTSYVDVFMPLFVGATLFRTLVVIERHLRTEREKRASMESELNLAAKLQDILLPSELSGQVHGWGYQVESKAHGILGGDWIKVHKSERGALFILGDVVGKGPTAALTHSGIAASWAAQLKLWDANNLTSSELISAINEMMYSLYHGSMNTTFAMAEALTDGKVRVAAGGCYWLHLADGRCKPIISDGRTLLGIQANLSVAFRDLALNPGEWLICFTDGVIEGNRAVSRFLKAVQQEYTSLTNQRIQTLLYELGRETVNPDDASILILHYENAKSAAA